MKIAFPKFWLSKTIRINLVGWIFVLVTAIAISAVIERQKLLKELQTEASILHRLASQRADQHDAHLTSLSALAVAGEDGRQDLFLDVAATIRRFYPRIEVVDLISLADGVGYLSSRSDLSDDMISLIQGAARSSDGRLMLEPSSGGQGGYMIVKRSPNTDNPRFGLSLQIDAEALFASDNVFWARASVSRTLRLPDGAVLLGDARAGDSQFLKTLGSTSQPLMFEAGISPDLADLLLDERVLAAAVIATFLYLIAALGTRQLLRVRQAETQARLSAQDARLAHASRINAMGEMASGMAHELTQPLTAILSQAQAGRHIAMRDETKELELVLTNIAIQAKRASAILDRLRNWTRPQSGTGGIISVNDAVRGVVLLLRPDAERAGIDLSTEFGSQSMTVQADQVELEQIVFNLARNAMDAVSDSVDRRVKISARPVRDQIVIEVADSGPDVPTDIKPRIYEPFVTGKSDGTGLGLALCQRLAERMMGNLSLVENRDETVFALSLPDAASKPKETSA